MDDVKKKRKVKNGSAKAAEKEKRSAVIYIPSERSLKYLDHYRDRTGNSYNRLVEACVDQARVADGLKNVSVHMPAKILKAQKMLEEWSARAKKPKRVKASAEGEASEYAGQ